MKLNPEDAEFFHSNMGGYVKEYEATTETQKYGVPLTFTNGAMSANTAVDCKKIKQAEFTGSTSGNADFCYTTKGAAKLILSFNLRVEQQFEVPLRHLSRVADCKQMFPSGKDYILSLHKAKEDFYSLVQIVTYLVISFCNWLVVKSMYLLWNCSQRSKMRKGKK